eukprot:COSAG01_NODE_3018_length_6713_cov_20.002570_5_plen_41_part_00
MGDDTVTIVLSTTLPLGCATYHVTLGGSGVENGSHHSDEE